MLTMDALMIYGADTHAGLRRCLNDEAFYLGLVEMLICDDKFDLLAVALEERNVAACLHIAYALADTAEGLALTPLTEQLEKLILCLQLQGDGAVLDRQFRLVRQALNILRAIQQE